MSKKIYELCLNKSHPIITDEMLIGSKHIRSLDIAKEVIQLPIGAFSNRRELKKVYFEPNSLMRKIPEHAFSNCTELSKLSHLPNDLISIEAYAFMNCTSLKEITIPENVEFVATNAFNGWKQDQRILCYKRYELHPSCKAEMVIMNNEEQPQVDSQSMDEDNGLCFFIVRAKCGHVGRQHYMPIDFPIRATSAKEAAAITKKIGRVKHNHKDVILDVRRVSQNEYLSQEEINKKDPYLSTKSSHEQDEIIDQIRHRLVIDPHYTPHKNKKKIPLNPSETTKDYKRKRVEEMMK